MQPGARVFGNGFGEERLVAIDLNEMVACRRVLEQLGPVGDVGGINKEPFLASQL
jgi:hypothetical protein